MSCWLLMISVSLVYHWSPHPTLANETPNHLSTGLPLVINGEGTNGSGKQVIYIPPRAYLLCWKGMCGPRLWAEMAKRTPYYNFGLGKRSGDSSSSIENSAVEPETSADIEDSKRGGAPTRYNFGIGKKDDQNQRFNFGLGKRDPPPRFAFGLGKKNGDDMKHRFGFGLGKRAAEETDDGFNDADQLEDEEQKRQLYNFGLGKKSSPYSFGLGKRATRYDFGLGKRGLYQFGLGKRSRKLYGFGLGKREIEPMQDDEQADVQDDEEFVDDEKLEKRAGPYSFGLGKRSIDYKRNRYTFGLGKRSETTTSPPPDGSAADGKDSSRTTLAPTLESHH